MHLIRFRQDLIISIHAPREGSDMIPSYPALLELDFNPRSP